MESSMTVPPAWVASARSSSSAPWIVISAESTGPPSNASSMRTESGSSANGHHLGEDAVDGVGMDESDLEAEEALAGLLVDQVGACGSEAVELGLDVVDLVRDVVHSRPAAGQEPADGRLLAERREQLDPAGADEHGRRLDALLLDAGAMLDLGAEQARVRLERLVQVLDGHAEMMDATCDHAADANGGLVAGRWQSTNGADRLGRPRLRADLADQLLELLTVERLALEQLGREAI